MACAVSWPTLRHRQNSFPAFFEAPHLQNIHAFAFCFCIYGPDRCFFYQTNSMPMHTHTHTHNAVFIKCECVFVCVYIHIRGVTVHKIHGSVRYDTVVSRFGMFLIRGAGQLVMSQCWKYFCFKPWGRANGYQTSTHLHQGLHNEN